MNQKNHNFSTHLETKNWKHTIINHKRKLDQIKKLPSSLNLSSPRYFPLGNHIKSNKLLSVQGTK